ncbi:heme-dependent peroxidase [Salinarchaeum sp. IM2453]|uniref:hydrogen peroxide-dependent heme synthase n=1 Tax=Salinarchaeum sp. IM2453 TaxID=2862870 RepID=UPI001C83ACE2|nr:hydrogen peroxide-dependent heme synthase [Salinarchaeum sp. IM2453]QZA88302.1 heme-dependent peroxidase [Salinarchaeum sp. IM2453]
MTSAPIQGMAPPQTDEGWYAMHDFRKIDWQRWRETSPEEKEAVISEATEFFQQAELASDASEGESAVCSILGADADLLLFHLRPTMDHLSAIERQFNQTKLASYTTSAESYIAVTEISDYVSESYFEEENVSPGMQRYVNMKLYPSLPDDEYLCFYPMDRRRREKKNWYTESFEKRAAMMAEHGDTGKQYAGHVSQIVTNSIGFDDHEWGVTLFADDPVKLKDIVYEMRFDKASSEYADFPYFHIGRRFAPTDLPAFLSGEVVPSNASVEHTPLNDHEENISPPNNVSNKTSEGSQEGNNSSVVYACAAQSSAALDHIDDSVNELSDDFTEYDSHIQTTRYKLEFTDDSRFVISIWKSEKAAHTATDFLSIIPKSTVISSQIKQNALYWEDIDPDRIETLKDASTLQADNTDGARLLHSSGSNNHSVVVIADEDVVACDSEQQSIQPDHHGARELQFIS